MINVFINLNAVYNSYSTKIDKIKITRRLATQSEILNMLRKTTKKAQKRMLFIKKILKTTFRRKT